MARKPTVPRSETTPPAPGSGQPPAGEPAKVGKAPTVRGARSGRSQANANEAAPQATGAAAGPSVVESGAASIERVGRSVMPEVLRREEFIRERAYFIYLERGGAPGNPQADWLQAERELFGSRSTSA
jgi:hypothetical protein